VTPEEQFPDEMTGDEILVIDKMAECFFTQSQYRVIILLMRESYGRTEEQIADGTGDGRMALMPSRVAFAAKIHMADAEFAQVLDELVALGVVVVDGEQIGFNMQFDQWRMDMLGSPKKKRGH
jgi:hypothetical protein